MKNELTNEDKIELIASYIGSNFIKVATALRELQDEKPDIFLKVAARMNISSRKAYALARISRQFDDLGVPEARLRTIGWTKLQIIGRYLTDENAEYLLQLAEQNTAHDLELLLRGETPIEDAKVVLLYLAPSDYERLRKVLIKNGAVTSGTGLAKMEAALMKLVDGTIRSDQVVTAPSSGK